MRMNTKTPISLNAFNVGLLEKALAIPQLDIFTRKGLDLKLKLNLLVKIPNKINVTTMVVAAPIRQNNKGRGGVNGSK